MQGDHKVNRQSIVAQDWQAVNLPVQPKRFGYTLHGHKLDIFTAKGQRIKGSKNIH